MSTTVEGEMIGNLDVKRFYMPGVVVKTTCPSCASEYMRDMGDTYLVYPPVGRPYESGCYCEECEHEWYVMLQLSVSLEAVEDEG